MPSRHSRDQENKDTVPFYPAKALISFIFPNSWRDLLYNLRFSTPGK
ncbi:hypothetical protein CPter291_0942 [Collimonas pratensis]|uniref:Uncharacterized protein n=1 Tax=Collimonas pratensis TaxID=279113 RepID=A0ABN4M6N6_9BURK|nr:hypothetical protein CPter291_0942 [Collimonas pratensis]